MPMGNKGAITSAIVSSIISQSGIENIIGSPGSRNMPLLTAFKINKSLRLQMVIDERAAAFNAIGYSSISGKPVVVCCTSGSAMLNYAPAVAEAFYRNIPIFIVSADRPLQCLGQGEPQMIDQTLALNGIVEGCYDIDPSDDLMVIERKVNEAVGCLTATSRPVHLNVRIAEPFVAPGFRLLCEHYRIIDNLRFNQSVTKESFKSIVDSIANKRILIYIGQHSPDKMMISAASRLSLMKDVVIAAESISNLQGCSNVVYGLETALKVSDINDLRDFIPDIIIMIGGTPTGRSFRRFVEEHFNGELWRVGTCEEQNDLFRKCCKRIIINPPIFMKRLASALRRPNSCSKFDEQWHRIGGNVSLSRGASIVRFMLSCLPQRCNIELSNGLSVRYASLFRPVHHRYSSNRGVNGIDGSTSTAIGASAAYSGITVLITGDMSAFYDVGAYFSPFVSSKFRIIVLANRGGGIFRRIESTRGIEFREELVCCCNLIPDLAKVGSVAGFDVRKCGSENVELLGSHVAWLSDNCAESPRMLIVDMPE